LDVLVLNLLILNAWLAVAIDQLIKLVQVIGSTLVIVALSPFLDVVVIDVRIDARMIFITQYLFEAILTFLLLFAPARRKLLGGVVRRVRGRLLVVVLTPPRVANILLVLVQLVLVLLDVLVILRRVDVRVR
jgi:hypothetical protein